MLVSDTVADYDRGEDVEILRSRYQDALAKDDANRTVVWAGTGVGLIDRIQSAKVKLLIIGSSFATSQPFIQIAFLQDIVNEIHEQCLRSLSVVSTLMV